MAINRGLIELRLQQLTGCGAAQARRIIGQYLMLSAQQCLQHITKPTTAGQIYISANAINQRLDCVRVRGCDYRIWTTIQENIPERLFSPINIGNNLSAKISLMALNYDLEDIIMASGNITELVRHLYEPHAQAIMAERYDVVKLDMLGIRSFIQANKRYRQKIAHTNNTKLQERLDRNLKHAIRLETIGQYLDGEIHQVRSESDFGRIYYTGPNLQNTPRIVRHAALGDCHEYDIESSVFAWKMGEVDVMLRREQEHWSRPATLEYLDHKQAIRARLARLLWDSDDEHWTDIIKQAITAIGFGARRSRGFADAAGQYQVMALEKIITSSVLLDRFMMDAWVQEFITEQENINRLIMAYYEPEMKTQWLSVPGLTNRRGSLRPTSVISYLYQHREREILEWLREQAEPADILLTVHDCIYTRRSMPLRELRSGLQQFGPYFRIDHKVIRAYRYDQERDDHYERIMQEEQQASAIYGRTTRAPSLSLGSARSIERDHGGGGYHGSGYDGTGLDYDPVLDPAVDDAEHYHEWRAHELQRSNAG